MQKTPVDEEREAFEQQLIRTGKAQRANSDGSLPPGATHEIMEVEGRVVIVRRRFSYAG